MIVNVINLLFQNPYYIKTRMETVLVIGLVEFWFAMNWAIQQRGTEKEEKRLFYETVLRAKISLFLKSQNQEIAKYDTQK